MSAMYKVMLVDDEILDLKGMRTFIPWNELGMEVAAAVNNGFSALEFLENESVDVLVTDVRMPNMTGLELAKQAIDKYERLRVIFVSGYQDFQYIKQAMTLNAFSYVLKPMDDQELVEALQKVRADLDEEKKKVAQELAYHQMVPLLKNEYMLQLLNGESDASTLQKLRDEHGFSALQTPFTIAVLEDDERAGDWVRSYGIRHICKVDANRYALFCEQEDRLTDLIQALQSATIGIGLPVDELEAASVSYRQALEALDLKIFHGKGSIIHYSRVHEREMEHAEHLDIQLDALFEAMSNYELVRIHDELASLYELAGRLRTELAIHSFTMYIIMKLDNHLQAMNESLFELLGFDWKSLDVLESLETIDEINGWLRRKVYELSELLQQKKQRKNWKLIQQMIAYIQERLSENVTLKQVADTFSFSPNYLGQLFKEEMNQNFSEFLISLRMEKAGQLLRETNMKVYEVAEAVGYRYLPYFSRQFKEYYGSSPLEYRRKG